MSELFAGKYLLKERLGVGGWPRSGLRSLAPPGVLKTVVIKRILPHLADDDNFITMFEDEAPSGSAQPPTRRARRNRSVWGRLVPCDEHSRRRRPAPLTQR